MSVPAGLIHLVGDWTGITSLWLSPDEPPRASQTAASISLAVRDQALTIRYTWSDLGEPQEGMLVIQYDAATGVASAAWTDTWHVRDAFMTCRGEVRADGDLHIQGTYAAPTGPDWGWKITIEPQTPATFRLRMYNISPEGESGLAVEANYLMTDTK